MGMKNVSNEGTTPPSLVLGCSNRKRSIFKCGVLCRHSFFFGYPNWSYLPIIDNGNRETVRITGMTMVADAMPSMMRSTG